MFNIKHCQRRVELLKEGSFGDKGDSKQLLSTDFAGCEKLQLKHCKNCKTALVSVLIKENVFFVW